MNSHQPALLLCLALIAPAVAADTLPRFEISPYVGYRGGGQWNDANGDGKLDSDVSYGVVLNFRASYRTMWEVFYGHQATNIDLAGPPEEIADIKTNMDYLHVGGTYVFSQERLAPFFSLTFGVTRFSPDEAELSSETYFSGAASVGLRYDLTPRLGLRVEGRAHGLFGKSSSLVFCDTSALDEVCFLQGDRGIIPQFEATAGLSFRF